MQFVELKLCEKAGKILAEAKKLHKGSDYALVLAWLNSEVFSEIIKGNEVYCSQARTYVARCFMRENDIADDGEDLQIDGDVLFWFGYLAAYWCFEKGSLPDAISRQYDIRSILNGYEALHSVSVKMAIDKIMEDYHI